MAVTRDQVLHTALGILDEYGLADLTMRRVAAALGVQPGALYWHVANKQSLLIALADLIVAELAPLGAAGPDTALDEALVEWGMGLHTVLLAHRSGAELLSAAVALRPSADSPAARAAAQWPGRASEALDLEQRCGWVLHQVIGATLDLEQRRTAAQLGLGPSPDQARVARELRTGLARLAAEPGEAA